MNMILGIHHLGIHTSDIDRLVSFYERAFGFVVVGKEQNLSDFPEAGPITGVKGPAARFVLMKAGNCHLELFQWSAPVGRPLQPLNANDFGYTHFSVSVVDIEAEYQRLSALGMKFVHPSPVKSGSSQAVYGRDPDGNIIEIMQIPSTDEGNVQNS
jgi:catechol 2,3-dioxygenase-like lactoylglutathione lyase family enzyme